MYFEDIDHFLQLCLTWCISVKLMCLLILPWLFTEEQLAHREVLKRHTYMYILIEADITISQKIKKIDALINVLLLMIRTLHNFILLKPLHCMMLVIFVFI